VTVFFRAFPLWISARSAPCEGISVLLGGVLRDSTYSGWRGSCWWRRRRWWRRWPSKPRRWRRRRRRGRRHRGLGFESLAVEEVARQLLGWVEPDFTVDWMNWGEGRRIVEI
jgi:hypothetical protein